MHIRSVRAELASCPFDAPRVRPFSNGTRLIFIRNVLLVAVETEEGPTGYGEGQASWATKRLVEEAIAERLFGRQFSSVEDIESLWNDVVLVGFEGRQDRQLTVAMGGVDVALYDILGKAEGKPIYELLGGKARETVRRANPNLCTEIMERK